MGMEKILILDGHTDIRRLIHQTPEFEHYEIHDAADGQTAWDAVSGLRPDVLLLDVTMPGALDGLEVCCRIQTRQDLSDVRVWPLSARGPGCAWRKRWLQLDSGRPEDRAGWMLARAAEASMSSKVP